MTKTRQIQDDLHFSLPTSCTCPDGSQPEVSRLKINFSIRLCRSQRKLFPAKNPNVLNPDSSQRGSGWPAEGKGGEQVSWRNSFGIEWYWANFLSAVLNEGLSRSAEAEQFWDRIIFSGENLDQFSYHQYSARRTHVGREMKLVAPVEMAPASLQGWLWWCRWRSCWCWWRWGWQWSESWP